MGTAHLTVSTLVFSKLAQLARRLARQHLKLARKACAASTLTCCRLMMAGSTWNAK
jgi:hypothetical protein